jgi:DNA-binding MarR family transcriptional regulator
MNPDRHDPVKQSRSPDARALVGILHTAGFLRGELGLFFREHGLTMPQYNVLRILRGAGPKGLPSLEIARRVIERVPDMTRLVSRLESAGLVRRAPSPEDGRVRRVIITAKGLRTLAPMDVPLQELEAELFGPLSAADRRRLDDILRRVRETRPQS